MSRGPPFLKAAPTPGKLAWLLVAMMGLAFAVPSSYAADPGEEARLRQDVAEASKRLHDVCLCAWKYDNLRPTTLRAVAPIGGLLNPPQFPVVHLSPGSPDYRTVVGEMMYCNWFCVSRQQRLAELAKGREPDAQPDARAAPIRRSAADEEIGEETQRVENELDHATASYGRACAWAWPYINLRPLCHAPGFEAATILNPFIPVPKIRLSEASPDYKVIVAAMNHWEPKIPNAKARLKDLLDDRKSADSAAAAVAAAAPKGKPLDKKVAPEDGRLAQMFEIYEQLKPALNHWRKDQYDLEMLADPWYLTKCTLVTLQVQAQALQWQIYVAEHDKDGNWVRTEAGLRSQLAAVQGQIIRAQYELGKDRESNPLAAAGASKSRRKNRRLDGGMGAYLRCPLADSALWPTTKRCLCLTSGLPRSRACGSAIWLAASRICTPAEHVGDRGSQRVVSELRLYEFTTEELALITALEAYALCKQNETRDGSKLFAEAKKLDRQAWVVCQVRGWSNLEQKKYSAAKSDFQMALSLSKKRPGRAARGGGVCWPPVRTTA